MTKYGSVKILSYFIVEKKRNMQFVKIQINVEWYENEDKKARCAKPRKSTQIGKVAFIRGS